LLLDFELVSMIFEAFVCATSCTDELISFQTRLDQDIDNAGYAEYTESQPAASAMLGYKQCYRK
jgi:hypothetical protein